MEIKVLCNCISPFCRVQSKLLAEQFEKKYKKFSVQTSFSQLRRMYQCLNTNFTQLIFHNMTYQDKATDIYTKLSQGKLMDAFEQYYGEHVVMIEADGRKREGKDANRQYEQNFLGMIKEFHGMGIDAIAADEQNGITTVESWMDITFQDGNRATLKQVAVQRWQGDHIVEERFYNGSN